MISILYSIDRYLGRLIPWINRDERRPFLIGYESYKIRTLQEESFTVKPHVEKILRDINKTTYMATAFPVHIANIAPYVASNKSTHTLLAGNYKRFLKSPPKIADPQNFKRFVRSFLHKMFSPLKVDADTSYQTFRSEINHPEHRKVELDVAYDRLPQTGPRQWAALKKFVKIEFFDKYKHARLINARCDLAKVKFGPYIHAIEKQIYNCHFFAKHMSVSDRPKILYERFSKFPKIMCSDYTAFESHMTKQLMNICESQLVRFMLRNVPNGRKIANEYVAMLEGKNKTRSRLDATTVMATRMSGEMSTSLSNGFTNICALLFMKFTRMRRSDPAYTIDTLLANTDLLVEGDDAVMGLLQDESYSIQDFEKVGLSAKIDIKTSIEYSRFCQIAFDKTDMQNIGDIRRILRKVFWTTHKINAGTSKLLRLLRAKGLSLLNEFPACPVITSVGKMIIRLTRGVVPDYTGLEWKGKIDEKSTLIKVASSKFTEYSRYHVAKEQGISIEMQRELEQIFDTHDTLTPIELSHLHLFSPEDYNHFNHFVEVAKPKELVFA